MKKTTIIDCGRPGYFGLGFHGPRRSRGGQGKDGFRLHYPQDGNGHEPGNRDMSRDRTEMNKDWFEAHQTSKLTGTEVRNKEGEDLGKIKDFVIDSRGRVQYALLSEGGVMGVGSEDICRSLRGPVLQPERCEGPLFHPGHEQGSVGQGSGVRRGAFHRPHLDRQGVPVLRRAVPLVGRRDAHGQGKDVT